ncbi:response regulator [Herminiimonas arsenitoxidans]|uniref:response regulator n=1 Tax=Herminiimonas arsenitoxidans TaxID=1809410 RepID=UPI00097037F4|nr:response regulator transcription factor [Herminiimonas arsenitoxidans]
MRILIIEDDPLLADGISQLMRTSGHNVDSVASAELAAPALASEVFDLILLDVGLPGIDGFEFLKKLRADNCRTPVLVLTARDALNEKVRGLNLGADDYLTKPFASEELFARVTALERRMHGRISQQRIHGPLVLDEGAHRAWLDGKPLDLPLREWAILLFLLDNVERVVSKERITRALCNWEQDMSGKAVEVYVSRLRTKLEAGGIIIRTVRGIGYMLEENYAVRQPT